MKKNGFTLIELILSISLITIIGVSSFIVVINHNKNKEIKVLEKNNKMLENALSVYLDSHPEVTTNLDENAKAAIVTLEVLKEDGLIKDNLDVDYSNNYFLLSNAKLLESKEDQNNVDCDNDVISIEVFKKWDLSEENGSKVMYVCPKSNSNSSVNFNVAVDEFDKRLKALEEKNNMQKFYYTGESPNNYVKFDVENNEDSSSIANWANTDLWRIVSYYGNDGSSGNIRLIYTKPISYNDDVRYIVGKMHNKDIRTTTYYPNITSEIPYINDNTKKYKLENMNDIEIYDTTCEYNNYNILYVAKKNENMNSEYIFYTNYHSSGKTYVNNVIGIFNDFDDFITYANNNNKISHCTTSSISSYNKVTDYNRLIFSNSLTKFENNGVPNINYTLYNKIKNKNWIENFPYYYTLLRTQRSTDDSVADECNDDLTSAHYNYIGVLNNTEYRNTMNNLNKSWLTNILENSPYSSFYYGVGHTYYKSATCKTLFDSYKNHYDSDEEFKYYPVVTLKTGIKIVTPTECNTPGTENCPYELEYNTNNE